MDLFSVTYVLMTLFTGATVVHSVETHGAREQDKRLHCQFQATHSVDADLTQPYRQRTYFIDPQVCELNKTLGNVLTLR